VRKSTVGQKPITSISPRSSLERPPRLADASFQGSISWIGQVSASSAMYNKAAEGHSIKDPPSSSSAIAITGSGSCAIHDFHPTMETPQNAWDRANYIAHSLSPKQQLGEIIFDTNGQRLAFFGIEFHCDTEARSFCTRNDDGSHNLVDYVLLTHNLRFMPQISTTWRGWDRYRFFVRALDEEASTSLHQGSAIPASDLGNWFYKEKGPGVSLPTCSHFITLAKTWATDFVYLDVAGCLCSSIQPPNI
jgi:hypothetical protein